MKITTLLLIVGIMQVSGTSLAQKVVLNEKNAPLAEVFEKISQQTGYDFIFTKSILNQAKPITLKFQGELKDALKKIIDSEPLDFEISDKSILVKSKEKTSAQSSTPSVAIMALDINGRVTDTNNQPLSGATVIEKGTNNSTGTDANGFFTLKQVQPNATIVISFIGYDKKEVAAQANLGQIKLTTATSKLDEVQVIAYGQTTQRLSVGNTATVKGEDIAQQPVQNALVALTGRVPGLQITQTNGIPGGGVTVRIQGQNSIANGNDPFYVIDGVPFLAQLPTTGNGAILGTSGGQANGGGVGIGNPLSYLNPGDIESITVLKDADATAIYGSRAANGAILITTKKGKSGAMKADINLQQGYGQVGHFMQLMNTQQYLEMRREAFKNDGLPIPSITTTPSNTDYDVNGLWDQSRYTDWQKVLIGGTAQYTNLSGTISGGTASTQYLAGGTWNRQTTVFPGGGNDQKGAFHFSLNSASADQKFHFQLSANYMVDINKLISSDLTQYIFTEPDAPALYKPDGTLNWAPNPANNSSWSNPLANALVPYQNKTNNLIANSILSYQLASGLVIRSSFGYTHTQTSDFTAAPLSSVKPEQQATTSRYALYGQRALDSWIIEPQLDYNSSIGKGKVNILAGGTVQQNAVNQSLISGTGYSSDLLLNDLNSAATLSKLGTTLLDYKYLGLFGRINYTYDNKYIISLNARRDGSSRFGPQNQFHDFWSAGGAWIFSEESLIKHNFPVLSTGKIRASYGTTGSDQTTDYTFLSRYNSVSGNLPYQNISALTPAGIANPYIAWEETKKLSAGIDLGFLNDRIVASITYARNRSSNQLLRYSLPTVTGFNNVNQNFPATIQNRSWEFSLSSVNIKGKSFSWTTNFNLTLPQNRLIAFPDLATSTYANTLIIGQPLGIIKAYHFLGVDPATGLYTAQSAQGTPTSNPNFNTDRTVLIDQTQRFYGGLQNHIGFNRLQVDFLLQFVKQIALTPAFGGGPTGTNPGTFFNGYSNQPASVLDRWQQAGDVKPIQQFNTNYGNYTSYGISGSASDAGYTDASYIRLKSLSISYLLPDTWSRRAHLRDCSLFLQGENLLTITKYTGLDPESLSISSLPPLRMLTAGIKLGL